MRKKTAEDWEFSNVEQLGIEREKYIKGNGEGLEYSSKSFFCLNFSRYFCAPDIFNAIDMFIHISYIF